MAYPFKILHALDTGLRQQIVAMGDYLWKNNDVVEFFKTIVMNSNATQGIKIGNEKNGYNFGWRTIAGHIRIRDIPATDPVWREIGTTGFWAFKFALDKRNFIVFHLPHDYVPNTQIYLNCHWLSDGTDVVNTVKWQYTTAHALSYGQEPFNFTTPQIVSGETAPNGQYYHMNTAVGPITVDDMQAEGIVYAKLDRITNGATDNTDGIFVLAFEVSYQSTNLATKNRQPPFYTGTLGTELNVLNAAGTTFTASLSVLSADGTPYTVTTTVLDSAGNDFDCI